MDFLSPDLQRYAERHTQAESTLLKRLDRETNLKALYPKMISGHLQGRILAMLSHMIKPQRILEIGTYTGYSAICLAEGLQPQGRLVTIDKNRELADMVQQYLQEAGIAERVDYKIGDAKDVLAQLQPGFDLIFLDADKSNYSLYFDLTIDLLNSGGFLIADNVLWYGKVINPSDQPKVDKETKAIIDFNRKVQEDPRVENVLLPVRDGLMIMRKL